jgi:hypothetical protein
MTLVNAPVPLPSVVLASAVVGFAVVLQHTPRAVTAEPPSAVTFPPLAAVIAVIELPAVVVTVDTTLEAVKPTSAPYDVPTPFVAYARTWYGVPGESPEIELVNTPVPLPSVVLASAVVGFAVVLQHTPRAVTADPPSAVTFPPLAAPVDVIPVIAVVVTVATTLVVVKPTSPPYDVPTPFVA